MFDPERYKLNKEGTWRKVKIQAESTISHVRDG